MNPTPRIAAPVLEQHVSTILSSCGLDAPKAAHVARMLVLTDKLRRHTHGVALVPLYVAQLKAGLMGTSGEPEVITDKGGTVVWDGHYLPGLWLVNHALDLAFERVKAHGVVTFAIRRSHHIACLAALTKQATDRGLVCILATSDPSGKFVAPFGGKTPVLTPNPFAIGYPGTKAPVLVDICASITTVSMTRTKAAAGEEFEQPWLMDASGRPTRDPRVLEQTTPRGSLMLLGGADYGHKGFGLALMVEALTQGLSGHGRLDDPGRWGGNVFLQVLDPEAFAGRASFLAQMDFIGDACRDSEPAEGHAAVRLPGEQAAANIVQAEREGIALSAKTLADLRQVAQDCDVAPLQP